MWHKYKTNIRKDYIDANLVDGAKKGDKAYAGSWPQAPVAEGESISSMTMHKFKNCDWITHFQNSSKINLSTSLINNRPNILLLKRYCNKEIIRSKTIFVTNKKEM